MLQKLFTLALLSATTLSFGSSIDPSNREQNGPPSPTKQKQLRTSQYERSQLGREIARGKESRGMKREQGRPRTKPFLPFH